MRLLIVLLLVTSVVFSQPALDGFMRGKSNLDLAASVTYESYGQYYQSLNDLTPVSRTSIAGSIYGSLGITNWMDAQVNIPYIYTSGSFSNFQDISVFMKLRPIDIHFDEGSHIDFMVSLGGSEPMSQYNTENLYSIGQRATAVDGRMIMQYSAGSGFFIMAQGGYTYCWDPVPSGIPVAFKTGLAKSGYYLDLWYDQQIADGGYDYADYKMDHSLSFRTFGVSYGKLGISYYKPIKSHMGISAVASYILWGRNVGQALGLSLGYVHRINLASQ